MELLPRVLAALMPVPLLRSPLGYPRYPLATSHAQPWRNPPMSSLDTYRVGNGPAYSLLGDPHVQRCWATPPLACLTPGVWGGLNPQPSSLSGEKDPWIGGAFPSVEPALLEAYQSTRTNNLQAQDEPPTMTAGARSATGPRTGRKKKAPYCALCGKKGHYRATCKVLSQTPALLDRYAARGDVVPVNVVQQALKQDMKILRRPNHPDQPSGPKKIRKETANDRRNPESFAPLPQQGPATLERTPAEGETPTEPSKKDLPSQLWDDFLAKAKAQRLKGARDFCRLLLQDPCPLNKNQRDLLFKRFIRFGQQAGYSEADQLLQVQPALRMSAREESEAQAQWTSLVTELRVEDFLRDLRRRADDTYEREVAEKRKELQRPLRKPRRMDQSTPLPGSEEIEEGEDDSATVSIPESSGELPPGEVRVEEEEDIRILRIKKATSYRARPSTAAAGLGEIQEERKDEESPPRQMLEEEEESSIVPQEASGMGLAERRSPSDWMRLPFSGPERGPEVKGGSSSEASSTTSEDTEEQKEIPIGGRTAVVSRKYTTIQKETLEITIRNEKS